MESILPWVQFGIAGTFLALLFLGLRSGVIYTRVAVDRLLDEKEKRLIDKNAYIDKLETLNEKLDQRNELLASKISSILEVSRAQGMIDALPPQVTERVLR